MRPIKLSQQAKTMILSAMTEQFSKALDDYEFNMKESKFSFEQSFSVKAKEKITIKFTPLAYLRCLEMVKNYSSEIGWYGLIRKLDDRTYLVYDTIVCKQRVNGARVITDDADNIEFYESLTDEQAEFLHFHAHSHVNMPTYPSPVDIDFQKATVQNTGGHGFYLFQIWNKSLDISSFLYDLERNIFYDKDDIDIVIEDPEYGTLSGFIDSLKDKVLGMTYSGKSYSDLKKEEEKVTPINDCKTGDKAGKKNEEEEETAIISLGDSAWYWNDGCGHEGYDF